jgi:hypothetical protein
MLYAGRPVNRFQTEGPTAFPTDTGRKGESDAIQIAHFGLDRSSFQ